MKDIVWSHVVTECQTRRCRTRVSDLSRRRKIYKMNMSGWWLLLCAVITASAQVSQEIEAGQADRRSASAAAQTGNGKR